MNVELAWLDYQPLSDLRNAGYFADIRVKGDDPILQKAKKELETACASFYPDGEKKTVSEEVKGKKIELIVDGQSSIHPEGFHIKENNGSVTIKSSASVGVLYGVFEWIRCLQVGMTVQGMEKSQAPDCPFRIANHWDNMDGSIERGYSGESFFFENEDLIINERLVIYARLLASVGINATVINNVNVKGTATRLIEPDFLDKLKSYVDLFESYGVKLYLSLNYAAPIELGGLDSADPLDEAVIEWWEKRMEQVYKQVPELGGFLVKADSEGRPGPFTYGRNQAEGANMLAKAIKPYNGTIIWRCFVYNCQQDWRDRKTDRARAGYDYFSSLDGDFDDNVILQIKNGPMDFQVREPVSPLIGGMRKTNQILEVQIAQEYTGQQRHVCYLIPMFKEVLAFDTHCKEEDSTVSDIVRGKTFNRQLCGMATVMNTGNDANWTGHDLAAANFYGFGRLSYNLDLTSEEIAKDWTIRTFGLDEKVVDTVTDILMSSWPAYEKYTVPLGIGWMVEPNHHYGPNVDGYEYSRWGTYHYADHLGMGVDRSDQGTGYALQYHEPNRSMYNTIETCPEPLLLFFHHVPYTHQLSTGKSLIQHIYDTHFEGVKEVERMRKSWEDLAGSVDEKRYVRTLKRFDHQLEHAKEWRDQVNTYFYRKSGIDDEGGRKIY